MTILNSVRNIHAIGRNYVKHILELGNAIPDQPVLFSKSPSCLSTGDQVLLPRLLGPIHHELELVLRIGRRIPVGHYVDLSCISHVALGLDFTARDVQTALKQKGLPWHLGKNFADGCYVTDFTDSFDLEQPLHFSLHINGQARQIGDSSLMIHSFDAMLRFINRTIPLEEGDLIYTGTPEGVGSVAEGDQLSLRCDQLQIAAELRVAFFGPEA